MEIFDAAGVTNCSGTPKRCTPIGRLLTGFGTQRVSATAGLVFVSAARTQETPGPRVLVFDLAGVNGCTGTPSACQPLKSLPLPDSFGFPYGISVANGIVAVAGDGGAVHVFALPQ